MECQVRDIRFHYEEAGAGRVVLLVQKTTLFRTLVSEWLDRVEEYALAALSGPPSIS